MCKTLNLPWDLFGVKVCADSDKTKPRSPLCVLTVYTCKKITVHINLWKLCWYHAYFFKYMRLWKQWFSVLEFFQAKKLSNFSASSDNWIEYNARPGFWREYMIITIRGKKCVFFFDRGEPLLLNMIWMNCVLLMPVHIVLIFFCQNKLLQALPRKWSECRGGGSCTIPPPHTLPACLQHQRPHKRKQIMLLPVPPHQTTLHRCPSLLQIS